MIRWVILINICFPQYDRHKKGKANCVQLFKNGWGKMAIKLVRCHFCLIRHLLFYFAVAQELINTVD